MPNKQPKIDEGSEDEAIDHKEEWIEGNLWQRDDASFGESDCSDTENDDESEESDSERDEDNDQFISNEELADLLHDARGLTPVGKNNGKQNKEFLKKKQLTEKQKRSAVPFAPKSPIMDVNLSDDDERGIEGGYTYDGQEEEEEQEYPLKRKPMKKQSSNDAHKQIERQLADLQISSSSTTATPQQTTPQNVKTRKMSSSRVNLEQENMPNAKRSRQHSPKSTPKKSKWAHPTKTPTKPLSSWGAYVASAREATAKKYPDLEHDEIIDILREHWEAMPSDRKTKYEELSVKDSERYVFQVQEWAKKNPEFARELFKKRQQLQEQEVEND